MKVIGDMPSVDPYKMEMMLEDKYKVDGNMQNFKHSQQVKVKKVSHVISCVNVE